MTLNTTLVDVATKDLSGAALDWAVSSVEGVKIKINLPYRAPAGNVYGSPCLECVDLTDVIGQLLDWSPSTNWSQGGALIHKYRMSFATMGTGPKDEHGNQPIVAIGDELNWKAGEGPTHLIAACRSIVRGALGDIVKVPACLVLP